MKGLLLKDLYTLLRQAKVFLFLILWFALMPGVSTLNGLSVLYAAMLPMTALAYDERAKWDALAAMMPYAPRDIVLSKYLLGYMGLGAAAVLTFAIRLILAAVRRAPLEQDAFLSILLLTCVAGVFVAISLPLMFRFGVEKGRLALIALVAGGSVAIMLLGEKFVAAVSAVTAPTALVTLAFVALAVLLNIASVALATAMYKRRSA